jgi:hypothetical protein
VFYPGFCHNSQFSSLTSTIAFPTLQSKRIKHVSVHPSAGLTFDS